MIIWRNEKMTYDTPFLKAPIPFLKISVTDGGLFIDKRRDNFQISAVLLYCDKIKNRAEEIDLCPKFFAV